MKKRSSNFVVLRAIGLVAVFAILAACSKDKQVNSTGLQDEAKDGFAAGKILKEELVGCKPNLASTRCSGEHEYLLVRTIEEVNGNNPFGAVPGIQDNYGAVRVKITDENLEFLPSSDHQFTEYGYWGLQRKVVDLDEPIVSFPILKHFDIGFEKNDYGEETNELVELEEGAWRARAYIRVDWASPKTKGFQLGTAMGDFLSITEEGAELLDKVKLHEDGSFSFDLKSRLTSIYRASSYSISTKTTLLKLKQTDHSARNYSDADFDRFGIFRNFKYKMGMQGDLLGKDLEKLAKIYNLCPSSGKGSCASNKVEIHLTEGMQADYVDLSIKAIEAWNKVFQKALDRTDDVVVYNPERVSIGEVQNNTIAYVDTNFVSTALLGVAQFTTNPLSGETISARSTIFAAGIERTKGAVDQILDALIVNPSLLQDFLFDGKTGLSEVRELANLSAKELGSDGHDHSNHNSLMSPRSSLQEDSGKTVSIGKQLSNTKKSVANASGYLSRMKQMIDKDPLGLVARLKTIEQVHQKGDREYIPDLETLNGAEALMSSKERSSLSRNVVSLQRTMLAGAKLHLDSEARDIFGEGMSTNLSIYESRQINLARRGIHGSELVEASVIEFVRKMVLAKLKQGLGSGLTDADTLKKISELLAKGDTSGLVELLTLDFASGGTFRKEVKDEVGKRVFYSTLLHEMGHSFGLRHNFIASVDEKNFHPKYHEIKNSIIACQTGGAGCEPELNTYDMEAWAFSSVMDYNAGFHSDLMDLGPYDHAAIQYAYNPAKAQTASFLFCTDEHVANNLLCNRFDKGINLAEITMNRINSYHTSYFNAFFRRGREFFGNAAGSMAMRYMLPIRTVMDESIYQLVNPVRAPEALQQETGCSNFADAVSNYTGGGSYEPEFAVNSCDNKAVELYLKKNNIAKRPSDLDAVEYLINPKRNYKSFNPLSRADLALSNQLAKSFFSELLGSGEPGAYLHETKAGKSVLSKLPNVGPLSSARGDTNAWVNSVYASLETLAGQRNEIPSSFAQANIRKVVNHEIGKAKYLKSLEDTSAGVKRIMNTGSIYEKYYAMLILSTRFVGVPKYVSSSLVGNAYLWPHTKDFAMDTFSKLIQRDDFIHPMRFRTIFGEPGVAYLEASQDENTQNLATAFSLMSFVTELNKSFKDKMKLSSEPDVCNNTSSKRKSISVELGGETICAFESLVGDSVVVPMLSELKTKQEEIENWKKISDNKPNLLANIKKQLGSLVGVSAKPVTDKIEMKAMAFPNVAAQIPLLISSEFEALVNSLVEKGLFELMSTNNEIQSQRFNVVIGEIGLLVNTSVQGGLNAFMARVADIKSGLIPRDHEPSVPVPAPPSVLPDGSLLPIQVQGFSSQVMDASRTLEAVSAEKNQRPGNQYMSDDELTNLARLYLDLTDYMTALSTNINGAIRVGASDILLDQAISDYDVTKAPVDQVLKMVETLGL